MTTLNPTGYCPNCKQQVLLRREPIDVCLAIILALFTAGIGLIIYLIIWYSKPENRCVHCNAICQIQALPGGQPVQAQQQLSQQPQRQIGYESPYKVQRQPEPQPASQYKPVQEITQGEKFQPRYCALCGEKLESDQKFCPNCGSEIS